MSIIRKFIAVLSTTIALIVGAAGIASAHEQVVQPGDTLSEIAAEWQVPGGWQAIYRWNRDRIDDPDLIYPGQVFQIEEHRHLGDGSTSKPAAKESRKQRSSAPATDKARPATGGINSPYLGGYRKSGGHSGTDFAVGDGNAYTAADGTVAAGFWDGAYGNKLVIDHGGGVETWYAHLASFSVSAGDQVRAGQKIGNIGDTGNTSGPHLHFEVRIDGEMTDPIDWLGW